MSRGVDEDVRFVHTAMRVEVGVRNGTALVLVVLMALIILAAVIQLVQIGE